MTNESFILWQVCGSPQHHLRRLVGIFPDLPAVIDAATHQFHLTIEEANQLAVDNHCAVPAFAPTRSVYLTLETQRGAAA